MPILIRSRFQELLQNRTTENIDLYNASMTVLAILYFENKEQMSLTSIEYRYNLSKNAKPGVRVPSTSIADALSFLKEDGSVYKEDSSYMLTDHGRDVLKTAVSDITTASFNVEHGSFVLKFLTHLRRSFQELETIIPSLVTQNIVFYLPYDKRIFILPDALVNVSPGFEVQPAFGYSRYVPLEMQLKDYNRLRGKMEKYILFNSHSSARVHPLFVITNSELERNAKAVSMEEAKHQWLAEIDNVRSMMEKVVHPSSLDLFCSIVYYSPERNHSLWSQLPKKHPIEHRPWNVPPSNRFIESMKPWYTDYGGKL